MKSANCRREFATSRQKKHLPPPSGDQQVLVTFLEPLDAET